MYLNNKTKFIKIQAKFIIYYIVMLYIEFSFIIVKIISSILRKKIDLSQFL